MIPSFHFHSATSLVFGRGVALQVGEHATARGAKRVFVITDATLVKVGLVEPIVASLKSAGLHVEVCDTITPEPPVEVIVQAEHAARKAKPDLLVAIGGGSNMDAAKLVAVLLAHGGTPADWVGDSRVPGPVFPLFCLPTTAGTGSEVSAAAVFTDTAKQIKVSTLSNYLRPALALVDPALTDRCPKQVSADSGIDALTHAIEAFTAVSQTEFARRGRTRWPMRWPGSACNSGSSTCAGPCISRRIPKPAMAWPCVPRSADWPSVMPVWPWFMRWSTLLAGPCM
jgi:alcohol dehydrogenase